MCGMGNGVDNLFALICLYVDFLFQIITPQTSSVITSGVGPDETAVVSFESSMYGWLLICFLFTCHCERAPCTKKTVLPGSFVGSELEFFFPASRQVFLLNIPQRTKTVNGALISRVRSHVQWVFCSPSIPISRRTY